MEIPYFTFILFIASILIYVFTYFLIKGEIFNLYSNNKYPFKQYSTFWEEMTSEQRLIFTRTYYQFYLNLTNRIDQIYNDSKNDLINIEKLYAISDIKLEVLKYTNLPYILVSLIPKNKNIKKKLLICSHFDGHNLTSGGTAYDDAIQVVSMLGTIDALTSENIELNTQVDFLFDGGEEYGLLGAHQYADYLSNITNNKNKNYYDYLNLESMGGSPPYVFVIKNLDGNYRVQKALSKTRGSILLSLDLIISSGIIGSTTDHEVFNEQGWKGGVSVFLGKASVYHSIYDKINKKEDLKITGNQLLDFVRKYNTDGYNGNAVGYGIAPICVVFPVLVMYILIPIIFIASIIVIILKERKKIKEFFKDLLKEFISFIIVLLFFALQGIFVFLANPYSPCNNQVFLILITISGLFLFLLFQKVFKIKKWSRFKLVLNSILMMLLINSDFSLPLATLTILTIIFYAFDYKIVKFILAFFQYLIMSLLFAFVNILFMQFSRLMPLFLGNVAIFLMFFIFTYHLSISPLELSGEFIDDKDKDKDKDKIGGLLYIGLDDNDSMNNMLDVVNKNNATELGNINESDNNDSNHLREKRKIINFKKIIPYLDIIIYIISILIILIIILFKPYPYTKEFTLPGTFFNVFKENETNSKMIFYPYNNNYKYPKKYIKKYYKNYKEENIENLLKIGYSGKSFVVESDDGTIGIFNDKCKNIPIPDRSAFDLKFINETSDGLFNYEFSFNIKNNSCIDIAYIFIHCKDCVKKIEGMEINFGKNGDNDYFDYSLRVGKEIIENDDFPDFKTKANFTLNTNKFKYMIILNTMEITSDFYKYLKSFGEGTVELKTTLPSDTLFLYEGSYS